MILLCLGAVLVTHIKEQMVAHNTHGNGHKIMDGGNRQFVQIILLLIKKGLLQIGIIQDAGNTYNKLYPNNVANLMLYLHTV